MMRSLLLLLCAVSAFGQVQTGIVNGTVVDVRGSAINGAKVTLSRDDQSPAREAKCGEDGKFSFTNVAPGPFRLTITANGFEPQTASGTLINGGEALNIPQIALAVATFRTDMEVTLTQTEIAEEQLKTEEKQRVLGIVPNYYVNYDSNAAPMTPKQKFSLTWKFVVDPVSFGINGIIAGVQQAQNDFKGFGLGTEGYAKRYASSYANFVTGSFISSAILPTIFKQDPRYFYKGTGTIRARILYAISSAVIRKGDNGKWQPNYSDVLGSLASGGISNFYYPAKNRDGVGLTFENALIDIVSTAGGNLIEEFLSRKITPGLNHKKQTQKKQGGDAPVTMAQ